MERRQGVRLVFGIVALPSALLLLTSYATSTRDLDDLVALGAPSLVRGALECLWFPSIVGSPLGRG